MLYDCLIVCSYFKVLPVCLCSDFQPFAFEQIQHFTPKSSNTLKFQFKFTNILATITAPDQVNADSVKMANLKGI